MSERNPFLIDGPAVISFSGGRTSGLMLYRIIEAHGGKLPPDVLPIFCNTGKEHDATLDFVYECGERWGVEIHWIEYVDAEEPKDRVRRVTYETASRDGEPFAAAIGRKNYLPNPVIRFCTFELKIHATHRYVHLLHWENWYNKAVGLRADEAHRVSRSRGRHDPWYLHFPLHDAGLTVNDVQEFWSQQPFRLGLPVLPDGTTPLGNCDLCFLKGAGKIASIIRAEPQRAVWWAAQEARKAGVKNPDTAFFRRDRPSYRQMMNQQSLLPETEDTIDCACTD
jgi:3'-phosphoadenosine 5'-phosphosulfate sulfotransferase (PAPS reductase)/FAD synthetase